MTVLSVSCHSVRLLNRPASFLVTAISFHDRLFCFLVHTCFIIPVFKHLKSFPWEYGTFVLYVAHITKRRSSNVDPYSSMNVLVKIGDNTCTSNPGAFSDPDLSRTNSFCMYYGIHFAFTEIKVRRVLLLHFYIEFHLWSQHFSLLPPSVTPTFPRDDA